MSEKLYKSHCRVPGHGTQCSVADDIYPSKKQLSKIRRRVAKKFIAHELSMLDEERPTEQMKDKRCQETLRIMTSN